MPAREPYSRVSFERTVGMQQAVVGKTRLGGVLKVANIAGRVIRTVNHGIRIWRSYDEKI
jgi:hypothetical protein